MVDPTPFLTRLAKGDTSSFEAEELTRALQVSESLGIQKDDASSVPGGSCMICWYPPPSLCERLALPEIPGAIAPGDMHMTLAYVPGDENPDPAVVDAVARIEAARGYQLQGNLSGIGRFVVSDTQDALVALVDVPMIDDLRDCIVDSLRSACVWPNTYDHGFTAHITLAYLDRQDDMPWFADTVPVTIDNIGFGSSAGDRSSYPLQSMQDAMGVEPDATEPDDDADDSLSDVLNGEPATYALVRKAATDAAGAPWRYTFGVVYAPDRKDAHGESASYDVLHRSFIDYAQDRLVKGRPGLGRAKSMHDTTQEVGNIVEIVNWPYEHEIAVSLPGGEIRKLLMPAGTQYMGVIWDESAWEDVQSGKIGGLSMGGMALRVATDEELPGMGDRHGFPD